MNNEVLMHHGVVGMKWGVRKQYVPVGKHKTAVSALTKSSASSSESSTKSSASKTIAKATAKVKNGTSTTASKIQQRIKNRLTKKQTAADKVKAADKAKTSQEKEAETTAAKKQRILSKRSGRAIYDNAELFTSKELDEAYKRLNTEKSLYEIDNYKKNQTTYAKTMATINKISKAAESVNKLATNVHAVRMTFERISDDNIAMANERRKKQAASNAVNTVLDVAREAVVGS